MFYRSVIQKLAQWKLREDRKPLILRGARQVGKTTVVHMFAKQFRQYIYLNLELAEDLKVFNSGFLIAEIVDAIFLLKGLRKESGKETLIFIDEIQNSNEAVKQLRYFYENYPHLYVICAGSLLESLIDKNIHFPVGRVEFLAIGPLAFDEFLGAMNESQSLELLDNIPFPVYGHDKLLKSFKQYTLIGGMPEIVANFAKQNDIKALDPAYIGLLASYLDDVEKYSISQAQTSIIRHIIKSSFSYAGNRIKFQGFGNSNYKSREIGDAFRLLEKTMILQLVYPLIKTTLPFQGDVRKSPKLQLLDTGLINYFSGLQTEVFNSPFIDEVYGGRIAEHIVGQELMALEHNVLFKLNFWTREEKDADAEVDYLYKFKDYLIPVEVKAGSNGRLRSLHEFIDKAPHSYCIRVYSGNLKIDVGTTRNGKNFFLLNLPFYLVCRIEKYMQWFLDNIDNSHQTE